MSILSFLCDSAQSDQDGKQLREQIHCRDELEVLPSGNRWIGVDLDGTLAHYDKIGPPTEIGDPIPAMVDKVKNHIAAGFEVRIFTARVAIAPSNKYNKELIMSIVTAIQRWTKKHIGYALSVTCIKDLNCMEIWDDRARQVEHNTGRFAYEDSDELIRPAGYC